MPNVNKHLHSYLYLLEWSFLLTMFNERNLQCCIGEGSILYPLGTWGTRFSILMTSGYMWPSDTVRRKCNVPTPSLLELQREKGVPTPSLLELQREKGVPTPSLFELQREKGERRPSSGTRTGVNNSPGNTRALFRPTRGKELGLWPGTWVFVGRPGFVTDPI